ncbi:hypothetical protein BCR44DRAFT_123093 [Catenaria anguillulae PL171]|uniref:Zn(2)-C6 fungal-type domain-containing protein n=1 Tax=Catenaria anguillulae PL171 TaxID=765915 RepID=A0A1Y2HLM9_9FUNG|nr:hypothetical protein BCR44DRAFT_123093 [Catenaria anguillulae PL171]
MAAGSGVNSGTAARRKSTDRSPAANSQSVTSPPRPRANGPSNGSADLASTDAGDTSGSASNTRKRRTSARNAAAADGANAESSSSSQQQQSNNNNTNSTDNNKDDDHEDGDKNTSSGKRRKRKKVHHACVYCRRSHMTCDEGRPCQRCIKRHIGHLCHDEPRGPHPAGHAPSAVSAAIVDPATAAAAVAAAMMPLGAVPYSPALAALAVNEFSVISDFVHNFDPGFASLMQGLDPLWVASRVNPSCLPGMWRPCPCREWAAATRGMSGATPTSAATRGQREESTAALRSGAPPAASSAGTAAGTAGPNDDKYLLQLADPVAPKIEDRLKAVINAKYEAGQLQPYNYGRGYARLQRYLETHMSVGSRHRVMASLGSFRPMFRQVAQSLTDMDLILVEEMFERLLLDYDHLFSAMGVPACLWRRTGEIYKANHQFADLVGVPLDQLRDGRVAIYELMSEDAAVNYWDKFGGIAFDPGQKAVLTSCSLKSKARDGRETVIPCCFSFTIRRDKYNMPVMIVGNFLPTEPAPVSLTAIGTVAGRPRFG